MQAIWSRIGFSWIGLIFLIMLLVPNIIWAQHVPAGYAEIAGKEPPVLVTLERIGEALACMTVLFTKELAWKGWHSQVWWLLAALALMILYEYWWIRYFSSGMTLADFYRSLWGIPVPGASLPVAALALLAIYAASWPIGLAAAVLGVGHIGIHLVHLIQISS